VPRAVLATHGHADHIWDAAELCARYDVPLRLHAADAYRLADPFGSLGVTGAPGVSGALAHALADLGLHAEDYRSPGVVEPFDGASGTIMAGDVVLRTLHAPGHTEGSTLYLVDDAGAAGAGASGVVLAGDVLFAGSIGRTDLPGGDPAVMQATLRDVVATLDPSLAVVPGHGPATSVGHELATNPFLN
jgi:glyoxylase-like metal-dependent hydrolase (beta-lactamase superfamily II)